MISITTRLKEKNSRIVLQKEFLKNKPFPHLIIKNFLHQKDAKKLLASLKKESFSKKSSDLFEFKQTPDLSNTKQTPIKEFFQLMNSTLFHDVIKDITKINVHHNVDMFGSLYERGNYLLCHDDQLAGRKIAYIYYLSKEFISKDGGALGLLQDKQGEPFITAKRIIPSWNTLVLFAVSPKSWHEVEEVLSKNKRYAIGGWLH